MAAETAISQIPRRVRRLIYWLLHGRIGGVNNKAYLELAAALRQMVDAIDDSVTSSGYVGGPIDMYLAGGMAVNY